MNIEAYKELVNKANSFLQAVENNEMYFQNTVSYDCTQYIHITKVIDIDITANKVKCEFTRLTHVFRNNSNKIGYSYSNMVEDSLTLSTLTPISREKFNNEVNYFKQSI